MRCRWAVLTPLALLLMACSLVTDFDALRGDASAPVVDASADVPTWDSYAAVDGPNDAPLETEAEADASPCDRTKPFGTPVAVAGLALVQRNEELVRFSQDLLTAWVLTRTPDINGVTSALTELTRTKLTDAFTIGTDLGISTNLLGTTGNSGHFGISGDRLRLVFADVLGKLRDCSRSSVLTPFSACLTLAPDASMPFLTAAGKRLFLVASPPTGTLAPATLDYAGSAWTTPSLITELDVYQHPTLFSHPALTSDEQTIVYEVSEEIWIAHTLAGKFGPPEKLTGLTAASSATHPSWIADDECTIALVSNRIGSMDVFLASRPK
ncbi:hypothetical protein BH09MYX1_BH09MYX1_64830 [soil metagenome]